MTIYRITAPNGKTYQIEGPPGASQEDVIRAVLAQAPEAGRAPPETTFLGQTKEAFKGLIPGAVGLVESAAIGASALLPEEQERAAREAIARVAGAAKAPFAPAPGYEESIPRKVTEAVGSTVPFLLAGPLGLAGRAAAVGLGVGAGAGEARTRAEAEGATAEQRGTATALGTIPGALEIFAPFRILSRIPEGEVLTAVAKVKRVLQAAGEEAAQEAASGLAQNMIARGVYKPEQELIEGLGEQAAYGGATGAIIQGLMDLALGRRARGAGAGAAAEGQPEELPVERLRREQAQEIATRAEAKREPINRAQTVIDETLAQPITEAYPRLTQEIETLKQQPESKERNAAIRELEAERARRQREDTERARAGKKVAEGFLTAEEAAAQGVTPREEFDPTEARREEIARLRAQREDMLVKGKPPAPKSPARRGFDELDARLVEIGGGRWTPTVEPPAATEPTTPTAEATAVPAAGLTEQALLDLGLSKRQPIFKRLLGKEPSDESVLADIENYLVKGHGSEESRTKLTEFKTRLAPQEAPAAEAPTAEASPVEPTTPYGSTEFPAAEAPTAEAAPAPITETPSAPSLSTESERIGAGVPVAGGPAAVSPAEGVGAVEPVRVVPPVEDAGRPVAGEGEQPAAVSTTNTPESDALMDEIRALEQQRMALLTKNGRVPAAKTPARKKYDELVDTIAQKKEQWAQMTRPQRGPVEVAETPVPTEPTDLTPEQRADLAEEVERISGRMSQEEYDNYVEEHVDETGDRIKPGAKHINAARELLRKYGGDTLYQRSRFVSVDLENSKQMDTALQGKSFTEAIDYAIKNARDDVDRAIMVKAKRRAEELAQKGVEFSFRLTAPGRVLVGKLGVTQTTFSGLGESTKVDVALNGYTGDPNDTLSQEVLAHEIVHAVTSAQIRFAPQGSAAMKLKTLQQEVVGEYNARFKAGALTAEEKDFGPVALESPSELLAYGLTNRKVQNWLASFKDASGKTFISRLFNVVSQVLGLKGKENTALAKLMSISEEMLDESLGPYVAEANKRGISLGKQENLTRFPSWLLKESVDFKPAWFKGDVGLVEGQSTLGKTIYVPAKKNVGRGSVDVRSYSGPGFTSAELAELRKAAADLEAGRGTVTDAVRSGPPGLVGEKEEATAGDAIGRTLGERKTIGLRVQTTDSLAGVEAEMGYLYGGNIRDNSGNMNSVVLLSQALDAPRFAQEMLRVGTIVVDPSGLSRITELDYNGQKISFGGVLRDIAAEAKRRGRTPKEFVKEIGGVLAGRREYELMKDNDARKVKLKFYLTPEEAEAANEKFSNDAFIKNVSDKMDAIRFAGLDFLVATGRMSKDKAKEWKEATAYTPFKRIEELDKFYVSQGQGGVSTNFKLAAFKQMKEFKGSSERQTENPIENFVGLMEWMTREGMKAEAVGRALRDLELVGAAKYLPRGRDQMPDSQKGAVVSSWQKGQQKFYYVPDPANLAAFAGAKSMEIGRIMRAAQSFSQVLRVGVTITPAFALKQIADDVTRAYVHSGVKNPLALTARILSNMPRNWWNEIRGIRSAGVAQLARMGVVPAYDTVQGGNARNIFEETGISKRSMGRAILRILEAGAKASDVSVRQAIYDQTMKETGDSALAEFRAREIINFSRRGAAATTDFLIRTIPFFNAYARSMDKLILAAGGGKTVGVATGYARNLFFKRMGILTAMGLSYALLMSDDEEYQNLSDHVRDRNWVLPYGKELGFTPVIPVPPELSFFFKAIPERVVQYYKLQGTPEERDALRVARELMLSGVDIFWAPNLTPQLVKPFFENLVNYSFFLGRPLESQSQLRLDASRRFGTSTSEAVKASAEALAQLGIELSPIKIENAIRGVLGMSAGVALSVADVMVNPTRTDRPLHQHLAAQLTGASAFMKDPVGTRFLDDMYDFEDKVAQAYNTYNRLVQTDPQKADAYLLQNYGRYSVYEATKTVMESIRDLNKEAQIVDRAKDIPPDERRQIMNTLRAQQNELAQISYALRRQAQINQAEIDLR